MNDTAKQPRLLGGYWTGPEIDQQLDICSRTRARLENLPDGLPYILIAGRKIYRIAAVEEWLRRQERHPNPTGKRATKPARAQAANNRRPRQLRRKLAKSAAMATAATNDEAGGARAER
jgi:hypothetical protein